MLMLPNFFILGAPKCGTTALYQYLCEHPNVWAPRVKEPNFFNTELKHLCQVIHEKGYRDMFKDAGEEILAAGDASVWYFYCASTVPNILKYNPDAKFMVMLRSPVQLLASLHNHYLLQYAENEKDFWKAWSMQDRRLSGELPIPKTTLKYTPMFYNYRRIGMLSVHLKRITEQVGNPKRLKVLLFDDMIKDTKAFYEDVLTYLDLPSDGRTVFPKANVRRRHRLPGVSKTINSIYGWGNWMRKKLGITRTANLWPIYDRLMAVKVKAPTLPREFQEELIDTFREDIHTLESMINRDLSGWLEIPQVKLPEKER